MPMQLQRGRMGGRSPHAQGMDGKCMREQRRRDHFLRDNDPEMWEEMSNYETDAAWEDFFMPDAADRVESKNVSAGCAADVVESKNVSAGCAADFAESDADVVESMNIGAGCAADFIKSENISAVHCRLPSVREHIPLLSLWTGETGSNARIATMDNDCSVRSRTGGEPNSGRSTGWDVHGVP